jgi:hypothetical protein
MESPQAEPLTKIAQKGNMSDLIVLRNFSEISENSFKHNIHFFIHLIISYVVPKLLT